MTLQDKMYLRRQKEIEAPKPDAKRVADKIIEILGKTTSIAIPIAKLFLRLKS